MSFYNCFRITYKKMQFYINEFPNQIKRKEKNSDSQDKMKQPSQPITVYEKTPSSAPFRKGGLTVEAAVAVPVFLFAVLALIYLLEIMSIEIYIRAGMQYAGKRYAENAYLFAAADQEQMRKDIVESVGAERIQRSCVRGGGRGIDCSDSYVDFLRQILHLKTKYEMEIPIPFFGLYIIKREETMRIKGWNGYVSSIPISREQKIVYVTEHGTVYHCDRRCPYLDLSIRMVLPAEMETIRNQSGGKYYPCERCGDHIGWGIYITDYGDRYHTTLSCSGLKRKIYAVPLSETSGKARCSKCGKQQ